MKPESKKLSFLNKLANLTRKTRAPSPSAAPKYFITFPYPYMNGRLHLGHLFSVSKAEFQSRYMEMYGYNVFFPFSFHCTGMPISANALKLNQELGNGNISGGNISTHSKNEGNSQASSTVSKILYSMGFTDLSPFTDPIHWLKTFPPLCQQDLESFILNTNWSSSFITTEINPFYDSFVRWQFRKLKAAGLVFFGKRYTIYCPATEQPCLDHDRSVGEGNNPEPIDLIIVSARYVGISEENLIKTITMWKSEGVDSFHKIKNSTVDENPEIEEPGFIFDKIYFAVPILEKKTLDFKNIKSIEIITTSDTFKLIFIKEKRKYLILDEIFYKNLKYQADIDLVGDVSYNELIKNHKEFVFKKIKHTKKYPSFIKLISTSDLSPEKVIGISFYAHKNSDYLKKISCINDDFQEIEKISQTKISNAINMTENVLRVYIPEALTKSRSGSECVVSLLDQWFINYNDCQLKIKTRKLIDNLKCSDETRRFLFDALDWIDKWGFSRSFGLGTRIPFDEKYLVDSLSDSTIYMAFYTVKRFLFSDFEGKRWIVNPKIVNDNLWDYVFGFTDDFNFENIPHPSDNLEILNSPIGNIQINAENLDLKDPEHLEIAASLDLKTILMKMKKSFEYFYPVDLRVSGKDLLKNHLIFFLMNHVAIFPEKFWPKRIFTNGHLLLNNEKMSKSTGNYLSAKDCLEKYGSLATRMALAHSGDFNEDANFQESIANSCILKIYNFFEFINKIKDLNKNIDITRTKRKIQGIVDYFYQQGVRELELQIEKLNLEDMETQDAINNIKIQDFVHELINLKFADKYFLEGIYYCYIHCISSYESMRYADVLKYGFYEMLHTKETYLSLNGSNESELMIVYVYFILMMMYPILPVCREVFEGFFDLDNENIPQPPIEVINDQFFRWPINIYDKGSSDNCLNYLMSTLDSLDNYKRMEYIKKTMRMITRRMQKSKNRKKAIILVSKANPEWKTEIDSILKNEDKNQKSIRSSPNMKNKEATKAIDRKFLIHELRPILSKYGISEAIGIGYAMSDRNALVAEEKCALKDLQWYLEENLKIQIEIREDEKAIPGLPSVLFE